MSVSPDLGGLMDRRSKGARIESRMEKNKSRLSFIKTAFSGFRYSLPLGV